MMLRGGRLAGLTSRVVGAKSFITEIFVSGSSIGERRPNWNSSQAEAEKAVKAMDGRILRGRLIFVEIAKECKST